MRYLSAALLVLWLGAPVAVGAQSYAILGAERHFRVEWENTSGRRGPVLSGYVYNVAGFTADHVRLAVESLDGAGQVTGMSIAYVPGTVPPGNRSYFEVPVRGAGPYRVRVLSYEPVGRGGA